MMRALVVVVSACGFQPAPVVGGGGDDALRDTNIAGEPGSEPQAQPIGCIPPAWHVTHSDDFTGDLSRWHLDTNVSPPTLTWAISNGALLGHSASSGTDIALVTASPLGDSAAVVHMRAASLSGQTGFRVAGPLVRATSIDGANNLYYGCLLDQEARMLYLARYDTMTQIGSGQGWTHLVDMPTNLATATLTVIVCAQGTQIACHVPELGLALTATDAMYPQGAPGLRVMLADVTVDDFTVYEP